MKLFAPVIKQIYKPYCVTSAAIIKMESVFTDLQVGAPIEVFAMNKAFMEDTSPNKVNLTIGGKYAMNIFFSLITPS